MDEFAAEVGTSPGRARIDLDEAPGGVDGDGVDSGFSLDGVDQMAAQSGPERQPIDCGSSGLSSTEALRASALTGLLCLGELPRGVGND
jgi:hypothetical protein